MGDPFRVYAPDEMARHGYPMAWSNAVESLDALQNGDAAPSLAIKDLVREQAGHRCVRCGHPYLVRSGRGEWSPCDTRCTHYGPFRHQLSDGTWIDHDHAAGITPYLFAHNRIPVEARWRILTVHHLNGVKADCRWWNLVALCQRCHLQVQGKVQMARVWPWEHSSWFRPYVAGYYASVYLGEELTRAEVEARLDELLGLERVA